MRFIFRDAGKSGRSIKGRSGLQELLRMVESGTADFQEVLVYDVSRWGRVEDELIRSELRTKSKSTHSQPSTAGGALGASLSLLPLAV